MESQEQKESLETLVNRMLVTDLMGDPCGNFTYDNVKYIHGEGGAARSRIKKDLTSIVQVSKIYN